MNRITNKEIMEKLETIQNNISNKEIIEKLDALVNAVNTLQKNVADKESMRMLSDGTKKSIVMSYAGLSLVYLAIGLTLVFSSLKLIPIQYSIIFGVFFGGSMILAFFAYAKNKEFKK
jgi:hypothetical protein